VERISWYRRRWSIEEFHKVLKSGCVVEKSRLQTAERLKRYIALLCVIAWRIFWLVHIQRANPGASAEVALTQAEIGVLRSLKRFSGRFTPTSMTVRQAVIAIACLGGYLNRKNDPPPGPTAVWRGWQRLASMSELYESLVTGCG
jgi:Transposase Tn5 dimerisation domain